MLAEQGLPTVFIGSKIDVLKTKVNVNSTEEYSLFIPNGKNTQLFYYKEDPIGTV